MGMSSPISKLLRTRNHVSYYGDFYQILFEVRGIVDPINLPFFLARALTRQCGFVLRVYYPEEADRDRLMNVLGGSSPNLVKMDIERRERLAHRYIGKVRYESMRYRRKIVRTK